jgi:hypothetical protein
MTLKEKFETTMLSFLIDKNQDSTMLDHFEQISDEFAIGFADWCKQEYELEDTSFHNKWRDVNGEYRESKELLEIYKTENGL